MISRFTSLAGYIDPGYMRRVYVEGSTSLWMNQVTCVVLLASCLLVSSIQYFGSPIQCVQDQKDEDAAINEHVMNTFCFVSSTYTVAQDGLGHGCGGGEATDFAPGIGPDRAGIRRHTYYVWIPFVLFFQALTFLLPLSCWRYCEGGLVGKLLDGVVGSGSDSSGTRAEKIERVAAYFEKRLDSHGFFCFAWYFHEVLSLGVAVGNLFLTDLLLGGWFWRYGRAILTSSPVDCGEDAFPKLTKCTFHKFGSGGSLQNFDSLCVMALNVVNEKVYTVLWFWFLALAPVSLLCLLYKTGLLACLGCLSRRRVGELAQRPWARQLIGCPGPKIGTCLPVLARRFAPSDWVFFACLVSGMGPDAGDKFTSELEQLVRGDGATRESA